MTICSKRASSKLEHERIVHELDLKWRKETLILLNVEFRGSVICVVIGCVLLLRFLFQNVLYGFICRYRVCLSILADVLIESLHFASNSITLMTTSAPPLTLLPPPLKYGESKHLQLGYVHTIVRGRRRGLVLLSKRKQKLVR